MPDKKLTDNLSNKSPILSNSLTDNEIVKAVKSHEEKLLANGLKCLEPFEVRDIVERQQKEINRLQAEKEALIAGQETLQKYIAEQKAENERLKGIVNIVPNATVEMLEEFAEQVKMAFYYEFDELIPSIMADKIDNLLKELVGDNNGIIEQDN